VAPSRASEDPTLPGLHEECLVALEASERGDDRLEAGPVACRLAGPPYTTRFKRLLKVSRHDEGVGHGHGGSLTLSTVMVTGPGR